MSDGYRLGSHLGPDGPEPVLVLDEVVYRLPERVSAQTIFDDWQRWNERLEELAQRPDLEVIGGLADVRLGPPVPPGSARNLYMAGANYSDHAREMRKLGADDPVPKPERGPFMFLKPTTTMIGDGEPVRIAPGCERVDWEVELAVVIGMRAERVAEERAFDYVAGYTVANDVSVRGSFVREDTNEAPMKFDWFLQKGWATSCPIGPFLVPAQRLPDAQDALMRLLVNGEVMQESRTSEMIFSIAEQIAFVSSVVALVPGDIICTGTCAGVGAGRGRFLAAGDVMVAEIEGIGRLRNEVVSG